MASLVITFTGPDRPGITHGLAGIVTAHEANWEESRMASLAGRFAGIVKVTVAEERADALLTALEAFEGLTLIVDRGEEGIASRSRLRLELTGHDHPGIVHAFTRLLVERNVNIEDMWTEQIEAPMAGGWLFSATAELSAPDDVDVDALADALDALADSSGVDLELRTD